MKTNRLAILAMLPLALMLSLAPISSAGSSGFILAATSTLPINPTNWVPIAFVAVLLIIAISAFVYVLSGLINSSHAKAWAQSQIYEALVSIVLLLIFAFFTYLFFLNPVPAFTQGCLVPGGACAYSSPPAASGSGCTAMSTNTIYSLAACDMAYFNNNAFNVGEGMFYLGFLSGLSPGIRVNASVPNISGKISASTSIQSFVPVNFEKMLAVGFGGLFFALVLNQIQSILIGGSLLFLALFMTIGLVARTFGITRTFGGTMIAFGIGLGLVYPLLVAITYGYINVQMGSVNLLNLNDIMGLIFSAALTVISGNVGGAPQLLLNNTWVQQLAFTVAGLTFIPFINFIILDAFIRDFSKAIGQQLDFMSLLKGLV